MGTGEGADSAIMKFVRADALAHRCRSRGLFDLAELFEAIADIWNAVLPEAVQRGH